MAIAFVSLLVILIVVIVGVPILARVFGEAASRGEDTSSGESETSAGRGRGDEPEDR